MGSMLPKHNPPDNRPIIISGPSGVGKGTLIQALLTKHPNTFALTTSHTTRKPRTVEIHSVGYHFVFPSEFSTLISQDAFTKHAVFSGHQYGTSKQAIVEKTAKGLIVMLDIEMNGVKQIKAKSSAVSDGNGDGDGIDARYVFVKPVSLEALEARLWGRGTESEGDVQKRLVRARTEMDYADTQGVGVFNEFIVNDDFEEAYGDLEGFVFGALS